MKVDENLHTFWHQIPKDQGLFCKACLRSKKGLKIVLVTLYAKFEICEKCDGKMQATLITQRTLLTHGTKDIGSTTGHVEKF